MAPSRDDVLKSAIANSDFEMALRQAVQPPMPANIDVPTVRNIMNVAKAKFRQEHGDPTSHVKEWEIEIPTRDGRTVLALVYGPSDQTATIEMPVFLFFHGGGFCVGNRYDDFQTNRQIAWKNNMIVISVEYRLAPEHPFPAAVHDGLDSLQWVMTNANNIHIAAKPSKGLIVGGVSAGGNIANAVLYLNQEQKMPVPVTGQFLSVPVLIPADRIPEKYKNDYISNEQNKNASIPPPAMLELFMGAYKPDFESILVSPFSRPTGHGSMPPTYLQACGVDVVRDDALIYERLLREDYSVATRLDLYSGLPHHFWEFFPQLNEPISQRNEDTVAGIGWLLEMGRKQT